MIRTPVSATIHFTVNGDGEANLRIEDERSHQTFLTIDFTPEQFRNMLASSTTSDRPIAELHGLDRVGKYHRHQSTRIKCQRDDVTDRTGRNWVERPGTVSAKAIADWFGLLPEVEGGWTLDALRRDNGGNYVVVARAYTSDPDDSGATE